MHEYIRRLDVAVENGFLSALAANRSIARHALDCEIVDGKECNCNPRYMCILKKKNLSAVMIFRIEDNGAVLEV